jgi:hypothetical protein
MANAVNVTLRPIYMEDLATTRVPVGDTTTENVLEQGPTTLTKIPLQLLTALAIAANDAAAAGMGVPIGQVYYNSSDLSLHTRMS